MRRMYVQQWVDEDTNETIGDVSEDDIVVRFEDVEKLIAENKRLQRALYSIENTPPANIQNQVASEQWWKRLVIDIRNQAREAVQEAEV